MASSGGLGARVCGHNWFVRWLCWNSCPATLLVSTFPPSFPLRSLVWWQSTASKLSKQTLALSAASSASFELNVKAKRNLSEKYPVYEFHVNPHSCRLEEVTQLRRKARETPTAAICYAIGSRGWSSFSGNRSRTQFYSLCGFILSILCGTCGM